MRVLHVLPRLGAGGVERGVTELALGLQQRGHHVIVSSASDQGCQRLTKANITHVTGPWHRKNPLSWQHRAKQLAQLAQQHRIDIIHAHSRIPCWLAHLSRRHYPSALVTSCYSNHGVGPWGLKKAYNQSMLKGDCMVTTSCFLHDYLKQHYHVPNAKVHRIARGADWQAWQADPPSAKALQQQWQLDQRPVVLFPARISRKKGQHLLLEALTHLPQHMALQIIFVGKKDQPSYHAQILSAMASAAPQHRILCFSNCQDMASAYHLADVVVNAAMQAEPFGRIPLEAGLAGRIVIVPRAGGFLETVVDGQSGYLYDVGSACDLAAKLQLALSLSPNQRVEQEAFAQAHIQDNFDLKQMVEGNIAAYQSVLTMAEG